MALQATLSASLSATLTPDTAADLEAQSSAIAYNPSFMFSNGSGANQANALFSDTRVLSAGASETIDLIGTLQDKTCDLISLTALKALIIRSHIGNPGDIVFGPNSSSGWVAAFNDASDRLRVKPGGIALLVAPDGTGYSVTAGNELLLVQNGSIAGSATYDIIFIGVDA